MPNTIIVIGDISDDHVESRLGNFGGAQLVRVARILRVPSWIEVVDVRNNAITLHPGDSDPYRIGSHQFADRILELFRCQSLEQIERVDVVGAIFKEGTIAGTRFCEGIGLSRTQLYHGIVAAHR